MTRFDPHSVRRTREGLLLRLLFRATQAMNAEMARRVRARGFRDFQPSFTALLAHIDTEGTRVSVVASRTGTTRQAASQMLDAIEARGYIARRPDPADGRATIVRHTPSGRRMLVAAIEIMLDIEREYAGILGAPGLERLKRSLGRLVERVDPAGTLGER